ncbi:MAG: patatin-like phospholipase family protein [Acidimicrobiales bacterium]
MLHALLDRGIKPDLIVGSSVGALNGALVASDPSLAMVERMTTVWGASDVFSGSVVSLVGNLARHGTHLHRNDGLRRLLPPGARRARRTGGAHLRRAGKRRWAALRVPMTVQSWDAAPAPAGEEAGLAWLTSEWAALDAWVGAYHG